jgi:hypothetical protein
MGTISQALFSVFLSMEGDLKDLSEGLLANASCRAHVEVLQGPCQTVGSDPSTVSPTVVGLPMIVSRIFKNIIIVPTFSLRLPDEEYSTCFYLTAVISTNELFEVWYVACNADSSRNHDHRPIVPEVVPNAKGAINEYSYRLISMPAKLSSEPCPGFDQEGHS